MRNISFSLTTPQFKARTKTVTRRLGWEFLKAGDVLMGCEKCMGLGKGGKIIKLGRIRVTRVYFETLGRMVEDAEYGDFEAVREGFPRMTGAEFVQMFCKHMKCTPETTVTRIEFEYLEDESDA